MKIFYSSYYDCYIYRYTHTSIRIVLTLTYI